MKITDVSICESVPRRLPVVPTIDVVVFPRMIVPLLVVDERIITGVNHVVEQNQKTILLLAAKEANQEATIGTEDLYRVGTVASIMRIIKMPDNTIKILVQGLCKARVQDLSSQEDMLFADIEPIITDIDTATSEITAQLRNIKSISEQMSISGKSPTPDFHHILSRMSDPEKIIDFIISHLNLSVAESQALLEETGCAQYLEMLYQHLSKEIEVAEVQEQIKNRARDSMNQSQREYYLREQLKAIRTELGEGREEDDIQELYQCLETSNMPEATCQEVAKQIKRLERLSGDSVEAGVLRNYIDLVLGLPWGACTEDNLDLAHAKEVLDADHYGMKEIKERILDFLSVKKLNTCGNTPILCLFGPPGTGKTSLGQSIARAIGRNYVRIALGGVKDESEIRGHRRTYVGAMPGRFIQGIKKAQSLNPVMIIDEIDKLGQDYKNDPSAAMLEVLDPEQNKTFYDNFLGIPFDLSQVFFIATANDLTSIPAPLKDRLEIIELSGYTLEEKCAIAEHHLIKKTCEETGICIEQLALTRELLEDIIANYTRESGVRELERLIKKLCSKVARALVENNELVTFTPQSIEKYLGPRRFDDLESNHTNNIGITNGLAWTSFGGEMIQIEAVIMPGSGKLILTGRLGEVMKESAQAALSYARAHAESFGISADRFTAYDIHIHVPAGAVPKDGPSAGVTILSSLLSALTQRPINAEYAMTGEIDLQGIVMPIGGVKEKILAAKRNKIKTVLLPLKNKKDTIGLEELFTGLEIKFVEHAEEVLREVLLPA
ncbi:TPA: endopeptidase La [Candidatus Dependentiae bacterium]|nr:endopeptidase La [Candidatus Dependentiae bacterium]